jgi:hypothetical protein
MGLFSISDIIISITLLINAIALLASSIVKEQASSTVDVDANPVEPLLNDNNNNNNNSKEDQIPISSKDNNNNSNDIFRLYKVMNGIRRMSCLIVIWNIFFMILMVFVFRD